MQVLVSALQIAPGPCHYMVTNGIWDSQHACFIDEDINFSAPRTRDNDTSRGGAQVTVVNVIGMYLHQNHDGNCIYAAADVGNGGALRNGVFSFNASVQIASECTGTVVVAPFNYFDGTLDNITIMGNINVSGQVPATLRLGYLAVLAPSYTISNYYSGLVFNVAPALSGVPTEYYSDIYSNTTGAAALATTPELSQQCFNVWNASDMEICAYYDKNAQPYVFTYFYSQALAKYLKYTEDIRTSVCVYLDANDAEVHDISTAERMLCTKVGYQMLYSKATRDSLTCWFGKMYLGNKTCTTVGYTNGCPGGTVDFNGVCLQACYSGYYEVNAVCYPHIPYYNGNYLSNGSIATCANSSDYARFDQTCGSCPAPYVMVNQKGCMHYCHAGWIFNEANRTCVFPQQNQGGSCGGRYLSQPPVAGQVNSYQMLLYCVDPSQPLEPMALQKTKNIAHIQCSNDEYQVQYPANQPCRSTRYGQYTALLQVNQNYREASACHNTQIRDPADDKCKDITVCSDDRLVVDTYLGICAACGGDLSGGMYLNRSGHVCTQACDYYNISANAIICEALGAPYCKMYYVNEQGQRVCLHECGGQYPYNLDGQCVESCNVHATKKFISQANNSCVDSCASGHYEVIMGLSYETNTSRIISICVDSCTSVSGVDVYDGTMTRCAETCADFKTNIYNATNVCSQQCPTSLPYVRTDNICVDICNTTNPQFDGIDRQPYTLLSRPMECHSACSGAVIAENGSLYCNDCPLYWDRANQQCVDHCDYYNITNRVCEQNGASWCQKYYTDPNTHRKICLSVTECQEHSTYRYGLDGTNECVTSCSGTVTHPYVSVKQASDRVCVASCAADRTITSQNTDTNALAVFCNDCGAGSEPVFINSSVNMLACQSTCPQGSMKAGAVCLAGYTCKEFAGRCSISGCDFEFHQYSDGTNCVDTCPDYVSGGSCVSSCDSTNGEYFELAAASGKSLIRQCGFCSETTKDQFISGAGPKQCLMTQRWLKMKDQEVQDVV